MSKFTIYDADDKPQGSISCPDDQDERQTAPPGMRLVMGEPPPPPARPEPIPEAEYVRRRRMAYPPLQAQLEMLWEAMDANQAPRSEPFYSVIKAIKLQFPKAADPKDHGKTVSL